jgi:hypothetical protein
MLWFRRADAGMRDVVILFVYVIVTVARLAGPGGLRSVVGESALVRHQLLVLNRGRKHAPIQHQRTYSSAVLGFETFRG